MREKALHILSVDWDWFFPDISPYDWGVKEELPLFYELIWKVRATNRNLLTKAEALKEMVPDQNRLQSFWEKVCSNKPQTVIIAESHLLLYQFMKLERIKDASMVNFDAHHDCGYNNKNSKPDCSNWVFK